MPAKGRTNLSVTKETFEVFEQLFKGNEGKWRSRNITSPTQLFIYLAIEKAEEVEKELDKTK